MFHPEQSHGYCSFIATTKSILLYIDKRRENKANGTPSKVNAGSVSVLVMWFSVEFQVQGSNPSKRRVFTGEVDEALRVYKISHAQIYNSA